MRFVYKGKRGERNLKSQVFRYIKEEKRQRNTIELIEAKTLLAKM